MIAQAPGADPAAVVHDALVAARARSLDIVIADTAGRLHTASGLMDELEKIKRVIKRFDATAPHETLLVLDASQGQNALAQALKFHERLGVTGSRSRSSTAPRRAASCSRSRASSRCRFVLLRSARASTISRSFAQATSSRALIGERAA